MYPLFNICTNSEVFNLSCYGLAQAARLKKALGSSPPKWLNNSIQGMALGILFQTIDQTVRGKLSDYFWVRMILPSIAALAMHGLTSLVRHYHPQWTEATHIIEEKMAKSLEVLFRISTVVLLLLLAPQVSLAPLTFSLSVFILIDSYRSHPLLKIDRRTLAQ